MFNIFKKQPTDYTTLSANNGMLTGSVMLYRQNPDIMKKQIFQIYYVLFRYYESIGLETLKHKTLQFSEEVAFMDFEDEQFNDLILPFRIDILLALFDVYQDLEKDGADTTDIPKYIQDLAHMKEFKGYDDQTISEIYDSLKSKRSELGCIKSSHRKLVFLPFTDAADLLNDHYREKSDRKSIKELDMIVEYCMNFLNEDKNFEG